MPGSESKWELGDVAREVHVEDMSNDGQGVCKVGVVTGTRLRPGVFRIAMIDSRHYRTPLPIYVWGIHTMMFSARYAMGPELRDPTFLYSERKATTSARCSGAFHDLRPTAGQGFRLMVAREECPL